MFSYTFVIIFRVTLLRGRVILLLSCVMFYIGVLNTTMLTQLVFLFIFGQVLNLRYFILKHVNKPF